MVTSRINLSSVIFISLFIIFNVNQGLSLKCYHCTSNSTGECWTEPTKAHLMECTEDTNTTAAPSTEAPTGSPTSPSTAAPTSPSTAAPTSPSTAAPTSPSTAAPTSPSTAAAPNAPSASNSRASFSAAIHNSRLRRSADLRADDDWECVKDISKDGDVEIVNRKCAKKNSKFCDGKDASSCFLCSNEDGCNSASSLGFQFISMVLPLAVALFLAR